MSRLLTVFAVLCVLTIGVRPVWSDPQPPESAAPAPESRQAELYQAFSKKLSGAALVGEFSVSGRETERPPSPERYELDSVTPLEDDDWMIVARIKYAKYDVKVPLRLKVYWADDTPVISLTDFSILGLGTFTARVMFYGDRYVGTWQHGAVGGHMWGHIEPKPASEKPESPAPFNGKGSPPEETNAVPKGTP